MFNEVSFQDATCKFLPVGFHPQALKQSASRWLYISFVPVGLHPSPESLKIISLRVAKRKLFRWSTPKSTSLRVAMYKLCFRWGFIPTQKTISLQGAICKVFLCVASPQPLGDPDFGEGTGSATGIKRRQFW